MQQGSCVISSGHVTLEMFKGANVVVISCNPVSQVTCQNTEGTFR